MLMSTIVESAGGASLKPAIPKPLFKSPQEFAPAPNASYRGWDMSPNGEYFYIAVDDAAPPITAVLNWAAGLRH
jgi:hypothetical protein